MLDDAAFMKEHVEILQKRVLEMRELMEKELTRMKIPFCKGYAGFFSWIDLRAYLKEDSFQGEQELCRFLYDHGNIIVAPGSVIQFRGSESNFRLSFVGFSSKFMGEVNLFKSTMDLFPVMIENPVVPLKEEMAEIYRDYFSLLYRMFSQDMLTQPNMQRCVLESMLCGISGMYQRVENEDGNHRLSRGEEICKELLRLVMKHYAQERRVSFYAEQMRLSAQHLCTTVKQQTGKTVADLIAEVVIMDAKALLKSTNMPIKEISISLNFPNVSFFGKYFKRYVGMSPQQYRNS